MNRNDRLADVSAKAEELSTQADVMNRKAKKAKRSACGQHTSVIIILFIIISIVVIAIILLIIFLIVGIVASRK